jgi:hypothetical protein
MIGDKLLDHQVGVLAAALKQDQRLLILYLGNDDSLGFVKLLRLILLYMIIASAGNRFTAVGLCALADALLVNRSLTHLDISKALCSAAVWRSLRQGFIHLLGSLLGRS